MTIKDLAEKIASIVGYEGRIIWDSSKPDGQPRRAVDGSRAAELLGWHPQMGLDEGLRATVDWFISKREKVAP